MATTPSTIVFCTKDKVSLPLKAVQLMMKQIFQYGVKDISQKGDKICIYLSYSPKTETVKQKCGNLPIRYIRTRIENEEELQILKKALKIYRFNLHKDDVEAIEAGSSKGESAKKSKTEASTTQTISEDDDDGDFEKEIQPTKKKMRKSQPNKIIDDDDEDFERNILT